MAAQASLRAAPEDEIAKAVYRLRIITRGREQRSDADREAEAVIWIEQLRCWPGDIVLDTLKGWPHRKDGQWWPTWHDVEAELRGKTSLRQAIVSHLDKPQSASMIGHDVSNQDLTPDQIAARSKLVDDWRASLSREAPEGSAIKGLVPATKPVLTDEEKADIISELSAAKDRPLTISHRFATLLQEQIAEGDEARQRRAFSASHQNELTP